MEQIYRCASGIISDCNYEEFYNSINVGLQLILK